MVEFLHLHHGLLGAIQCHTTSRFRFN